MVLVIYIHSKRSVAFIILNFILGCGQLPDVQFGKIHIVDTHNTAFGASARVTCDKGFESNTSTITCTRSGVWETYICKIKGILAIFGPYIFLKA
jgi:hypothetical protein